MATAKKLPSGSFRVRIPVTLPGGKKSTKSFTASTKREAERMAAEYAANNSPGANITVYGAIDGYINAREATKSPTTIRSYRSMQKTHYHEIGRIKLSELTNADIARAMNAEKMTAKTYRNVGALLMAAIRFYDPDTRLTLSMPQIPARRRTAPNYDDIRALLSYSSGELRIAIALGAFATLRRSEACALTYGDIDRNYNTITINKVMIQDRDKVWIIKNTTKTDNSTRKIIAPADVIALIPEGPREERIIKANPNIISKRFDRLAKLLEVNCSFHDLRHFAASYMHAIGLPDQYIQDAGGWKSDHVLKRVYRESIDGISQAYQAACSQAITKDFGAVLRGNRRGNIYGNENEEPEQK